MTRGGPTWRQIADQLAARLRHHAVCQAHPAACADDSCPFCRDRAAYESWVAKAGWRHDDHSGRAGDILNVFDLHRDDQAQRPEATS